MPTHPADRLAAIERYSFSSEAGARIETDEGWVRFSDAQSVIEGLLAELRTLQQQALAVVEKWRLFQDSPTENVDCAECPHLCACLAELRLLAALSAEREPEKPATLPSKD